MDCYQNAPICRLTVQNRSPKRFSMRGLTWKLAASDYATPLSAEKLPISTRLNSTENALPPLTAETTLISVE